MAEILADQGALDEPGSTLLEDLLESRIGNAAAAARRQ